MSTPKCETVEKRTIALIDCIETRTRSFSVGALGADGQHRGGGGCDEGRQTSSSWIAVRVSFVVVLFRKEAETSSAERKKLRELELGETIILVANVVADRRGFCKTVFRLLQWLSR